MAATSLKAPSIPDVVERLSRTHPDLSDDLRAEADLAILEADREGHDDEWVVRRLELFVRGEDEHRREKAKIGQKLIEDDRYIKVPPPVLIPSTMTRGQRKRFHRDMAIQILAAAGMPMRIIGEVFELRHSRVYAICQEDLKAGAKPR